MRKIQRKTIICLCILSLIFNMKAPFIHVHIHKRKAVLKVIKKKLGKIHIGNVNSKNTKINKNKNDVIIDNKSINEVYAKSDNNTEEINTKIKEPEWINIEISYYSNIVSNCGKCDSISANGTNLNKYVYSRGGNQFDEYYIPIACPKSIPFNTKLFISRIGNCICLDRGSSIQWKDNNTMKIDVYIPNTTDEELNKLGLKQSKGYIIKN